VRRNLLREPKWSTPKARAAAAQVEAEFAEARGRTLVLCGAKVAAAHGLVDFRRVLLVSDALTPAGTPALVVPHPSGRSREWNDPDVAARVRAQVMALVGDRTEDR
jgi:hypothetical protein